MSTQQGDFHRESTVKAMDTAQVSAELASTLARLRETVDTVSKMDPAGVSILSVITYPVDDTRRCHACLTFGDLPSLVEQAVELMTSLGNVLLADAKAQGIAVNSDALGMACRALLTKQGIDRLMTLMTTPPQGTA